MIDAISQVRSNGTGDPAALEGLDKDAFLKLLVAQLRYQNPMSPLDGQEYLAQAAQFATVERLEQISKAQNEIAAYQEVALSSAMVGKQVTGVPALGDGTAVTGIVSSVRFEGGGTQLILEDGTRLDFGAVEEVRAPGAGA